MGLELTEGCLDADVTQYYDPEEQPTTGTNSEGQLRNLRLLCTALEALQVTAPDCTGNE